MSVNYNLQMISNISAESDKFEDIGDCCFAISCSQKGLSGKRSYSWLCKQWESNTLNPDQYIDRLSNPLILDRLQSLDIMEMELMYRRDWKSWRISCESIIGSATWILIPPVLSMITPKIEECIKFLELYELLGDAIVNNKNP